MMTGDRPHRSRLDPVTRVSWAAIYLTQTYPITNLLESPSADNMGILPLYPPPSNRETACLPTLPARPRSLAQPFSDPAWTVSTHVFPAAFPRSRVGSTRRRGTTAVPHPTARMTKDELERANVEQFARQRAALEVTADTVTSEMEVQEQLWLCVNRYARSGAVGGDGFTIVCCHATGLHKEVSGSNVELCSMLTPDFRPGSRPSPQLSIICPQESLSTKSGP